MPGRTFPSRPNQRPPMVQLHPPRQTARHDPDQSGPDPVNIFVVEGAPEIRKRLIAMVRMVCGRSRDRGSGPRKRRNRPHTGKRGRYAAARTCNPWDGIGSGRPGTREAGPPGTACDRAHQLLRPSSTGRQACCCRRGFLSRQVAGIRPRPRHPARLDRCGRQSARCLSRASICIPIKRRERCTTRNWYSIGSNGHDNSPRVPLRAYCAPQPGRRQPVRAGVHARSPDRGLCRYGRHRIRGPAPSARRDALPGRRRVRSTVRGAIRDF